MLIIENLELSEILDEYNPFLKDIYVSSLMSFNQTENILRFNNCATNFRELFRLFFEKVSPDEEIKKAHWYVPNPDSSTGVTRAHRITYAIYKFIYPSNFNADYTKEVTDLTKKLIKKIDKFSVYTHLTQANVNIDENKAISIIEEFTNLFIELIKTIKNSQNVFIEHVENKINEELTETIFINTFSDIDELSTHTSVESVDNIEFEIKDITVDEIIISGNGNVYCELQYGSDSDQRNDNGYKTTDSYPFDFQGYIDTANITIIRIPADEIKMDTSEFFD